MTGSRFSAKLAKKRLALPGESRHFLPPQRCPMQAPSSRDGLRPAIMLLLCFIAGQAVAAPPATTAGKVVSVHDGDTVTVRTDDGQTLKVRL